MPETMATEAQTSSSSPGHGPSASATVVVIEDEPQIRRFLRAALVSQGYRFYEAATGREGLAEAATRQPDVIILDLGLPRLAGEDVGRELASHPSLRSIPIIVVTGQDTGSLDLTSFACVLHKPVTAEALVRAITDCLDEI